jgi:hypothetical protein
MLNCCKVGKNVTILRVKSHFLCTFEGQKSRLARRGAAGCNVYNIAVLLESDFEF